MQRVNVLRDIHSMMIATCGVVIAQLVLLGYMWSSAYATIAVLRRCSFADCVVHHPRVWYTPAPAASHHDTVPSPCVSRHYIQIARFSSYYNAVTYSVHIRDTYGLLCDIVSHDSVTQQNMVSWYTLVSHVMPSASCDTYIRLLQRCEHNIRVEKCVSNER